MSVNMRITAVGRKDPMHLYCSPGWSGPGQGEITDPGPGQAKKPLGRKAGLGSLAGAAAS